ADEPSRRPASHGGPAPSARVRNRQDKQEAQKTEEEDPAAAAGRAAGDETEARRARRKPNRDALGGTARIPPRCGQGCDALRYAVERPRRLRGRCANGGMAAP